MPVGATELEILNDYRLDLRAWIGLCELCGQIHPVHAALGGDFGDQMLARRFRKRCHFRTERQVPGRTAGSVVPSGVSAIELENPNSTTKGQMRDSNSGRPVMIIKRTARSTVPWTVPTINKSEDIDLDDFPRCRRRPVNHLGGEHRIDGKCQVHGMSDDCCTVIFPRHALDRKKDRFCPSGPIENSSAQSDTCTDVAASARAHEFGNLMTGVPFLELLMLK